METKRHTGKLLVLDGLDGSGKSTQQLLLEQYLAAQKLPYRVVSFPDYEQPSSALVKMYLSGEFGKNVNDVNAYAASSFYAVDRYASFHKFWKRDYDAGAIILATRYTTSNAIHQMSKLPRQEWDAFLNWLQDYEYGKLELPRPDMVFFLDMAPQVARGLISQRYGGDESKRDLHEADQQYLDRCRPAALYAAKAMGWQVISCDDGTTPLKPEQIRDMLLTAAKPLLAL